MNKTQYVATLLTVLTYINPASAGFTSVQLSEAQGGHIRSHINKTPSQVHHILATPLLTGKLKLPYLKSTHGVFKSTIAANRIIKATLLATKGAVRKYTKTHNYLKGHPRGFYSPAFDLATGLIYSTKGVPFLAGQSFQTSKDRIASIKPKPVSNACVVIRKHPSQRGWYVLTAYPSNNMFNCTRGVL